MSQSHGHSEKHFLMSQTLRDLVIGLSDGLTVPFALAAGLSGAVGSNSLIIIAGLSEIAAGAVAMGLGGYLSGKSEIDVYANELKREYDEVEKIPEQEKAEVRQVFSEFGMDKTAADAAVHALTKDKDKWVQFMMKFELGLERPDPKQVYWSALRIGGGYTIGGVIPLLPYFWANQPLDGLAGSTVLTALALMIFGYIKSLAVGQPPWRGAVKLTFIGGIAAAAAFAIAHFSGLWLH